MKLLFALFVMVAVHSVAQETYVVMLRDSQFTADGMRMSLKSGDCFPFVRWEPGNIWAVVNIHGYETKQTRDAVRLVLRSKEVEQRFSAAIVRLNDEHDQLVRANQQAGEGRARKQQSNEEFLKWYGDLRERQRERDASSREMDELQREIHALQLRQRAH